jgi:lysyl-tRNA synthetase class 2
MDLTEELVKFVAMEVNGTLTTHFNGNEIDLGKWERLTMKEAIYKWWPSHLPKLTENIFVDLRSFRLFIEGALNVHLSLDRNARFEERSFVEISEEESFLQSVTPQEPDDDPLILTGPFKRLIAFLDEGIPLGKAISDLFEAVAERHLIQPTIIYDFPLAVSPLSKVKPDEPDWVERFEFYIGGFELGNAFSELNDPVDQERRFTQQLAERQRGDDEAHQPDEDYVRALAYGLPPTAGEGVGIDRLTMVLTGARSIRDVILFPLMRSQQESSGPPRSGE